MLHDVAVEREERREALDLKLRERAPSPFERLGAVLADDDELGEHGVELAADNAARIHSGVDTHTGAGGLTVDAHRSRTGKEVASGILAVDAELEGMTARARVLGDVESFSVCDEELPSHQVQAGSLLGHRMLDLKSGVHLQKRHCVALNEVLDRARAVVTSLPADRLSRLVNAASLVVGEERRGRLLHQLLEATLQRAVAGTRDYYVAVLVRDHLGFDMAGMVQVLLDEAFPATERGHRLARGRLKQLGDLVDGVGDLHATAAATVRGFDRHRDAILLGERDHVFRRRHRILRAGRHRRVGAFGDVPGSHLVAEVTDRLWRRTDPDQPGVDHGLREVGVLGKESVAGVDGVGSRLRRGREDLVDVEIGVRGGLPTEGERLIGQAHKQCVGVGYRVDGDAPVTGVFGGSDDTHGNFSAVGNEHFGDG